MYNDARAVTQAQSLTGVVPADAPVHGPSASLPKLLWLLENQSIPTGAQACHQAEWILAKLAGRRLPGDENNCLKLGYDPISGAWPGWIHKLDIPEGILPEVIPAGQHLGNISTEMAALTGLPANCLLISGTTDSTAAALATGISNSGEAITSLGSTLVIKILSDQPLFSSAQGIYSHKILGQWLVGGASNSGGAVLRQYFSDEEMAELTAKLKPDHSTGLHYYPLPKPGERFPHSDPEYPVRISPVPEDRTIFFQALLEGITDIEQAGYTLLQQLGAQAVSKVYTTGGGSVNPAWRSIRKNRLGVPVINAANTEAAYGSAVLAMTGYQQPV